MYLKLWAVKLLLQNTDEVWYSTFNFLQCDVCFLSRSYSQKTAGRWFLFVLICTEGITLGVALQAKLPKHCLLRGECASFPVPRLTLHKYLWLLFGGWVRPLSWAMMFSARGWAEFVVSLWKFRKTPNI